MGKREVTWEEKRDGELAHSPTFTLDDRDERAVHHFYLVPLEDLEA